MSKVIQLKSTVEPEYKSKEGLAEGKPNDEWLHSELSDSFIREVNKNHRTRDIRKSDVELTLVKGVTGRTLNRSKLVKRATQVKGKDGKIYTRMQWVDPNKDMVNPDDVPAQDEMGKTKPKINVELWDGQDDILEATKVKVYDVNTQKGFIDKHLDGLSKDEKQAMINKFGLTWKKNQHASIDWKNAVMALKNHIYENPSLVGADHLPKENTGKTTLDGTDRINDFCNNLSKEEQYDLMRKYKIYDDVDPRTVPAWSSKQNGGDGTGSIRHMKNMMAFKRYLNENPHIMDGATKRSEPEPKKEVNKTPKPVGKNDMETVLKTMSDEDKYNLMRKVGIADTDPRQDPRYDKLTGDSTGAIRHMRNMIQLKKHLSLNPEDLSDKLGDEGVKKEKEKAKKVQEEDNKSSEVKDVLAKLSKESKLSLLKKFANEPEIKNRERKENPNIDYMRSMMALRTFLEKNPDKLKDIGDMAEFEELMSLKIPVKMIEKILRDIVGITSTQMDYATVVEKGKEWKFGVSSFAMIQTNDDGLPVLSVVDTGDAGADWEEYEYPMSQIRDFINKAKEDKANKNKSKEEVVVTRNEIPLHRKAITDIEKTLNKGFEEHYTDEVGEVLKPILAHYWDAIGHINNIDGLATKSYMTFDTMKSLMDKLNVAVDSRGYFDSGSDNWMRIACHDKITSTKTGNANDYMFINKDTGEKSAFALKESAKQWTSEERYEARGELVSSTIDIGDTEEPELVTKSLGKLVTDGTLFTPFDLMVDMMANGLSFGFKEEGYGCNYSKANNRVNLAREYINIPSLKESGDSLSYQPDRRLHPIGDTVAHEFAHAIDGYFTDPKAGGYLNWNSDKASKYVDSKYRNCVRESYYSKVDTSNPHREVIKVTFNGTESYYHKDEWMNTYESRIYGASDDHFTSKDGRLYDTRTKSPAQPMNTMIAVEHWSENVSRYARAFELFQTYTKENPGDKDATIDSWAEKMYKEYQAAGYGDDYTEEQGTGHSYRNGEKGQYVGSYRNRNQNPMQSVGYLYHKMKNHYPKVWEGIDHILNRPDFRSDKSTSKPTELASKRDFARKSLLIVRR